MMLRWLRNTLAALAFGMPSFREHEQNTDRGQPLDAPVEHMVNANLARGGTLRPIDKYEGRTIAGGPGSQKIGDTFDALPEATRKAMIEARGRGVGPAERATLRTRMLDVRSGAAPVSPAPERDWNEPPTHDSDSSHDKLARGINKALARQPKRRSY